jgi:LysM repeat protein
VRQIVAAAVLAVSSFSAGYVLAPLPELFPRPVSPAQAAASGPILLTSGSEGAALGLIEAGVASPESEAEQARLVLANIARSSSELTVSPSEPLAVPVSFQEPSLTVQAAGQPAEDAEVYRVQTGDTLGAIAQRSGLGVVAIMELSEISDPNLIVPGQELRLPAGGTATARAADTEEDSPGLAARLAWSSAGSSAPTRIVRTSFVWPTVGLITTYFGERGWASPRGHAGIDISAPWGTPVRAATDGKVVGATFSGGGYGLEILLEHAGGLVTRYAHLSQIGVNVGERVERGELIGRVGSTGFSTGPHLHFEVLRNGALQDPLGLLP